MCRVPACRVCDAAFVTVGEWKSKRAIEAGEGLRAHDVTASGARSSCGACVNRGALCFVKAFGEFLDHLFVEGGDFARLAARDEPVIGDDFAVGPVGAGVLEIGVQRWP